MEKLSKSEFKALYKKIINKSANDLRLERSKVIRKIILSFVALVSFLILEAIFTESAPRGTGVVAVLILLFYVGPALNFLKTSYKRKIIKPIVELTFPGMSYSQRSSYSISQFNDSALHRTQANDFSSEDDISGKVKETKFSMCEVSAARETGSGKNRRRTHIFKGFILKFDFNKEFTTHTVVRADIAESFFGSFIGNKLQSISEGKFKLIKLEDPLFEKQFVVYGESQHEARYILSPALMERILKLKNRTKMKISVSFYKSHLILALPRNKNYFEPSLFGELAPFKDFREIYTVLSEIEKIIDVLDLNTRIWTK